MLRYPTKINTTIPGLDVMFHKIGAYLYATVLHKESNLIALKFNGEPLPFGMREFVRRLDGSELATVKWDVSVDQLTDPSLYEIAQRARSQVLAG